MIDFCKFAVRVFEKCVYNLGKAKKGAKSPTTSNSIDDKKTKAYVLMFCKLVDGKLANGSEDLVCKIRMRPTSSVKD